MDDAYSAPRSPTAQSPPSLRKSVLDTTVSSGRLASVLSEGSIHGLHTESPTPPTTPSTTAPEAFLSMGGNFQSGISHEETVQFPVTSVPPRPPQAQLEHMAIHTHISGFSPQMPGSPEVIRAAIDTTPSGIVQIPGTLTPSMPSPTHQERHGQVQGVTETPQPLRSLMGNEDFKGKRYCRSMHSEQVPRYIKKEHVPRRIGAPFCTRPMAVDFPHTYGEGPGDWKHVEHPGGALYFYHPKWRAYTDVYMYDAKLRTEANDFVTYLGKKLEIFRGDSHPAEWEKIDSTLRDSDLVLNVAPSDNGDITWSYYYVNHRKKVLFWLTAYDATALLYEASGADQPGHVKLRLEALYWVHWSLYPIGPGSGRNFPEEAYSELLGLLTSCSIGRDML
ncbi:hypothetical protein BC834DRAFT_309401 [Gloeopeniophorella convolvens]|nr:hypothetical protein BC834DRAFT_309401 [Gloeopeniophorella convolvens]